jgi:hypothetical protein
MPAGDGLQTGIRCDHPKSVQDPTQDAQPGAEVVLAGSAEPVARRLGREERFGYIDYRRSPGRDRSRLRFSLSLSLRA